MTEILDSNGTLITVGARVMSGDEIGTVTELTEPDADYVGDGHYVPLGPYVTVLYDDGISERYTATWNATGPWDDDRDDYTCDDITVAVKHGEGVDMAAVEALERYASDREKFHDTRREDFERQHMREPDGQRMEAGRIVPTDR